MYTKSFNTKKTWLGAMFTFALVAIMGLTFAFKPAKKYDGTWFSYNPSGSQNSAASYTRNPSGGGCSGDVSLCEIYIENPSQDPTTGLSQTDLNALLAAENPGTPSPTTFPEQSESVHFKVD